MNQLRQLLISPRLFRDRRMTSERLLAVVLVITWTVLTSAETRTVEDIVAFKSALQDPTVDVITLTKSITFSPEYETAWDLPVMLGRNITITAEQVPGCEEVGLYFPNPSQGEWKQGYVVIIDGNATETIVSKFVNITVGLYMRVAVGVDSLSVTTYGVQSALNWQLSTENSRIVSNCGGLSSSTLNTVLQSVSASIGMEIEKPVDPSKPLLRRLNALDTMVFDNYLFEWTQEAHVEMRHPEETPRKTAMQLLNSEIRCSDDWMHTRLGFATECWQPYQPSQRYRGAVNVSKSGRACLAWGSMDPERAYTPLLFPHERLEANYCRQMGASGVNSFASLQDRILRPPDEPWCYVDHTFEGCSLGDHLKCGWEACEIPWCEDSCDCHLMTPESRSFIIQELAQNLDLPAAAFENATDPVSLSTNATVHREHREHVLNWFMRNCNDEPAEIDQASPTTLSPSVQPQPVPGAPGDALEAEKDDRWKPNFVMFILPPVVAVVGVAVLVLLRSFGKGRFSHVSGYARSEADSQRKLALDSSRSSQPSGERYLQSQSQDPSMDEQQMVELNIPSHWVKNSTFDPASSLAHTLTSGAATEVHAVGVFSRCNSPERMVQQANSHASVVQEGVQIQSLIGKGAFGCVFKGVWNNVVVAVKVVEVVTGASPAHEMRREATLTKSLRHPNIIATFLATMHKAPLVHVAFKNQTRQMAHWQAIMVLEYGEGDLKNARLGGLLRDSAGAPLMPRILNLLCDVANGMVYVHQRGIIHADLKPANIFYTWQLAHRTPQQPAAPAPSAHPTAAAPAPSADPTAAELPPSPPPSPTHQGRLSASAAARLEDVSSSSSGPGSGHGDDARAAAAVAAEAGVAAPPPPAGEGPGPPQVPGTMVDMVAKIGDFGLSRAFRGPPGAPLEDAAPSPASPEPLVGTVTHMPPEALDGGPPSPPGDVFAFGTVMWELYEQGEPYKDQGLFTKQAVVDMVLRQRRRLLFGARCPPAYRQLAERCWEHDPAERPSFEQVVQVLADLRHSLC